MAVLSKFCSHLASGARNLFNFPSAIGEVASTGAHLSLLALATQTTKDIEPTCTTTSPSSMILPLGTDTASECVKLAVIVALVLGLSSLGSVTQTAACQYRVQRDSVVKSLAADLSEKSSKAAEDASLIKDLTNKLSDLDHQHQQDIENIEADHAGELSCRDTELAAIKMQHQRTIDDIHLDHSEELSRRDIQISKINTQHQHEIDQVKSNHANELSLLSVDIEDARRENAHKQSEIASLRVQLKTEKERRAKPQVMRQTMANWDRIQKRDEKHELEMKQLQTNHSAALTARELEIKGKYDLELAAVVATTENRVKKAVEAELQAAKTANRDTEQLRTEVTILQRNVSLLKRQLRQAESSTRNHVDFGSDQREAESKAKIAILQTENKVLKEKAANAKEALRVCDASKIRLGKQRCENESDLTLKAEVARLKMKVQELEDLLRSAATPCNGDCAASKARHDELQAVIRNNRDVFERGKKHKNKQHRETTTRLEGEKMALQKEIKDLRMQLADQRQLVKSQEQQSKLSPVYTIISQDPNPLPSPSVNSNSDPTTSELNGIVEDTVAGMSVAEPETAPPSPTPFDVSAVTDTTTEEEKDVRQDENMTPHLVRTIREQEHKEETDSMGEKSTSEGYGVTPKKTEPIPEEPIPEEPTPDTLTTTMAETTIIDEPLVETNSTTKDATMKDSMPSEPTVTSPAPLAATIAEPDPDVLPDAVPANDPSDIDERMDTSNLPASQAEPTPPSAPLFSFGGANFVFEPSTQPFDFGAQHNQMPVEDHEMSGAEGRFTAQISGSADTGQHPENPMAYDYTGPAQSSDNSALYDLAMILKQYSSPSQPKTTSDGSAPRFDQSTEPVAMPSVPALPTAPNDGMQGQELASFPSIPGLQTDNIGGHPGQAADNQVDGSNISAPTAVEDSEMLAWKNLALIQAQHGPKTVPSVQSTAKTTPYQEPISTIPIDPSLLPGGVIDQPEPQAEPQPEAQPLTPARKVQRLPTRLRRPANLKPFEYNKDVERDHLLPKSQAAENLPLIVDLPDGGFSGSANRTPQAQQPPPSPPKVRTSSPVKRSSALAYDPLGKGKNKRSIFDDPTLFEKRPSSSSSHSELSDSDFSDCEGFGSKSDPSPTNPWNFSTAALRPQISSAPPKITEAPANPSDIDAENDDIYGHDDDSKKHAGPSSSHHQSDPAPSNHPHSTAVEPPRGVDHAGDKGKKRRADGSGGRDEDGSHVFSWSDWLNGSPSSSASAGGMEQRPVSTLPGLGSASGGASTPAFRHSTKAELDQVCRDMGIEPEDVWDTGTGSGGSGGKKDCNSHDQQDAPGANYNNNNDEDDDDAEILAAMRQNGMDSSDGADATDAMDHTEDNNTNPSSSSNNNNNTHNSNSDNDDDDLHSLTPAQRRYLDISSLTDEEKKHGRDMHKMYLDVEGECERPCRWCRELGLSWK
ncbi:MAG: hypothetical protein Q9208_002748 [Pyrenodesmia sp. 3 TL-2023]